MPKKPKTEYRIVCANHGTTGHRTHAYVKPNKAKAIQAKKDADHRSEMEQAKPANKRNFYYAGEGPWTVETREVSAWQNIET